MNSSRRRSAFSVFRAQQKHEGQDAQNQNDDSRGTARKAKMTPSRKRQNGNVVCKKMTKVNTVRDLYNKSDNASSQESDSSEVGNKKVSRVSNKLRQSLTLSSKKKRSRSRKFDREVEEGQLSKRKRRSEPLIRDNHVTARENLVPVNRPPSEEQGTSVETEADQIFKWLVSPLKPNKFFRCV